LLKSAAIIVAIFPFAVVYY